MIDEDNVIHSGIDKALAPDVEVIPIFGWDSVALIQIKHVPYAMNVTEINALLNLATKILKADHESITSEEIKLLRKAEGIDAFDADVLISSKDKKTGKHRSEVNKSWFVLTEFMLWKQKSEVSEDFNEAFEYPEYLGVNESVPESIAVTLMEDYEPKPIWFEDGCFFELATHMQHATSGGGLGRIWKIEQAIQRANQDDLDLRAINEFIATLEKPWTGNQNGRPVTATPYGSKIHELKKLREWLDLRKVELEKGG